MLGFIRNKWGRIEIDTYCDELPYEMSVNYPFTIYLPFGFYTTGSLCLFRNLTLPSKKKFNLDSIKCGQSCKKFHQTMTFSDLIHSFHLNN